MADQNVLGIDAIPQTGQAISHGGKEYTTIKEGLAYILVPHGIPTSMDPKMSKEDTQKQQVFYNPIQQFNRDLSVLAIKTFGEDLVERRRQKHEQQKKKNARQAEKKRKLQTIDDGQVEVQEAEDIPSKRIRIESEADPISSRNPPPNGVSHPGGGIAVPAEIEGDAIPPTTDSREWRPPFTILDALSATGLRALRYAKEIPISTLITANDISSKAAESISLNAKHNKLEDKITANTANAIVHMYGFADKKGYDVIDLDPYGTAASFIDAAIQAINDDGLLCVTCTDSAIFASHGYLEKTYSQYGGLPLKGEPCHEGGLRLLLHAIASSAGRYGMAIEPLLSLSIDYYIRVFVRVRKSPNDVKLLAGKTMIVYHCQNGCGSWSTQFLARNKSQTNRNGAEFYKHSFAQGPSANTLCEHCGTKTHLSGPMYGGPLHNIGFIERVLAQLAEVDRETYPTYDRIEGMLHTALEEITFGVKDKRSGGKNGTKQLDPLIPKADPAVIDQYPFFFIPSAVAKVLHCQAPPLAAMRGAIRKAGFKVSMSHCKPGSVHTTAPWTAIWHIMLEWVRQKAPLKNELKPNTAGHAIMSKRNMYKSEDNGKVTDVGIAQTKDLEGHEQMEDRETSTIREVSAAPAETKRPSYLSADFEVTFDEELGRDHERGKYVRYQLAPRENWGPMSRAK
jgi:tRNA (guanine26-N2/guanine27-N2)-dimethyltransferase